jgi:hypothetical protein
MAFRHVEGGEVVPVVLDLRPGGDGEAEVGENLGQLVHHLADRVDRALGHFGRGQGKVECLGCHALLEFGSFHLRLAGGKRVGHGLAQRLDCGRLLLPLFGRHCAQGLEQRGDAALLAEKLDAQGFQRAQVGGRGDPRAGLVFKGPVVFHRRAC